MAKGQVSNLDSPETYRTLDREGMLGHLHEFPDLCERAWAMAVRFDLPKAFSVVDKVLVLGMGGSAIGADLLGSLAVSESRVPVLVHRGYSLPAYVDSRTLVIASSYSGNTEETLSCFEQSLKTRAQNLAITTGGRLKELAERRNIPVFIIDYQSPPRAALPFSIIALLCFTQRLNLLGDKTAEIHEMISVLRQQAGRLNENVPILVNQAKQIARDLHGRLAVIYGAEMISEVAHRWKTQINENGKAWAFYEVFPELNHNAIVGYQFPSELSKQIMVVMLASSFLSPRVRLRYEITGRLLKDAGIAYRTVQGVGNSQLSHTMGLVLLGDYVSYYLALLYGAAPYQIEAIDYLKAELDRSHFQEQK